MRSNLLSLQVTQKLQDTTQSRLSTGLKVNSAIDNPNSFYIAQSLNNRANDLSMLLDSMGQGVQTIKAANEAIEIGNDLLQQAKAVANSAADIFASGGLVEAPIVAKTRATADFVADGYTVINSSMSTADIQALITDGAKLVLETDVVLDSGLNITAKNVTIDGNGYKMTYSATTANDNMIDVTGANATINNIKLDYKNSKTGSAITVSGASASVDISYINITATGTDVYGVRAMNKASLSIDNIAGISVSGVGSQQIVNGDPALFDGIGNTAAMIDQIGKDALAASAATQFYVGDKDGELGQGNWYLPSVGELMEVYGYNSDAMASGLGATGATGDNKSLINSALSTLKGKGGEAEALTNGFYWSSSEYKYNDSWIVNMGTGGRYTTIKSNLYYVRPFQRVENCFNPLSLSGDASSGASGSSAPKIGDIMYSDKSYGSASDFDPLDTTREAIGVVTSVSADTGSAKIMSLKDLTFSSSGSVDNFDPENPYGGTSKKTQHTTNAKWATDITDIPNYNPTLFLNGMKSAGVIDVSNTNPPTFEPNVANKKVIANFMSQFNSILDQYNELIKDASYKGINLLDSQDLKMIFNEDRSSILDIKGVNASSKGLGLNDAKWLSKEDISDTVNSLDSAINQLRTTSSEFGNSFNIVSTREEFTDNIINVLTEGADKLTLADMNEESANMLALQTRQQLAINSLSLASQSAQSILKLF